MIFSQFWLEIAQFYYQNWFFKWMKYFSQILGFYYQIFIDLTLLQHFYFCITFVNFKADFISILSGFGILVDIGQVKGIGHDLMFELGIEQIKSFLLNFILMGYDINLMKWCWKNSININIYLNFNQYWQELINLITLFESIMANIWP